MLSDPKRDLSSENWTPQEAPVCRSLLDLLYFSDNLSPLRQFLFEYSKNVGLSLGYLFESTDLPLTPALRHSPRRRSSGLCLKIRLCMADLFLVPTSIDPFDCALVIRPSREMRKIQLGNLPHLTPWVLRDPYYELSDRLLQLALVYEASL